MSNEKEFTLEQVQIWTTIVFIIAFVLGFVLGFIWR